jgi:hypothetical protein
MLEDIGARITTKHFPVRFVEKIASVWQEFLNVRLDMDDRDIILDGLAVCWVFGWVYIFCQAMWS